jgi:hypothetical protein
MSERFRMWDRMVLPHSVCRHQEFVKASRRESYGTHGTQVLTEPKESACCMENEEAKEAPFPRC